jgi:UDP-N-acetylglucosamine 1-carboxyvinyltransferase
MSHFLITGGAPLHGTVRVSGAKNAALPMMAAAILADGPVRLDGVPRLADVRTLAFVLGDLGVSVAREADGLRLETVEPARSRARYAWGRRMRASFCVLGPLLARRGRAVVPLPGGCRLGDRPVDLHLRGLAALGADIRLEHGCVVATARRLRGADIVLGGPRGSTVTGTANVLSAAVLACGRTTILGAAREPEIVDLGNFLNAMGGRIRGLGTPTLEIDGVPCLVGTRYRIIPDRIEAATLLLAAAITGGSATVTGVVIDHLRAVLDGLQAAGANVEVGPARVALHGNGRLRAIDLVAEPYPGMPTDLQAQWTALAALAEGRSRIEDRVFPSRFGHVAELNRLGARITCGDGAARIEGVARLDAARVAASDLRGSAALVLAGLAACGHTTVSNIHHLDRGYERLDAKLRQLGADICRAPQTELPGDLKRACLPAPA